MTGSRWAAPLLVAVGLAAWADALAGGTLGSGPAGVVLAAGAAFLAGRRTAFGPLAWASAAAAVLLAVADQVAAPGQFSLANDGLFYGVVVGAPALAGALIGARARQVGALQALTTELDSRRPAALLAARAEETGRVERRVDAALADRLRLIVTGIHAAAGDPTATGIPTRLAEVEEIARSALTELRDVLGVLGAVAPPAPLAPTDPAKPADATGRIRRVGPLDALLLLACVPMAVESVASGSGSALGNIAASLAQGVLLPVVRRRPLAGAAALMVVASVQTVLLAPVPPLVSWLLPGLLTAYLVGLHAVRRTALVGLAVTVGGVLVVTAATPAADRDLPGLAPGLAMGVLAWWAARNVVAREHRRTVLAALATELARTEDAESRLAAAEQRAELARELHDVGAHALTVVCLQTGAAQRLWDRDRAQADAALVTLVSLADGPLAALGRSLSGLSADRTSPALGRVDLEVLAGLGQALGLQVQVSVQGRPRPLPEDVARAAFRVVQESLTNVARHSARGQVRVGVVYRPAGLEVSIADGGPGPGTAAVSVHGAGIGLRGMRDRVEACRGRLDYGRHGDGFLVRALLPLAGPG